METFILNSIEFTIEGINVSFLDSKTGLKKSYLPKNISIDVDSNSLNINFKSKLTTATNFEISINENENYRIPFDGNSLITSSLIKTFINVLFQDVLKKDGIEATQVYNNTGTLEVKEKIYVWVPKMSALKGQLFSFNVKNYRCLSDHITVDGQDPTKAKTFWIEEK